MKRWTYDNASQEFCCIFPGCGYRHHEPGGVVLHAVRAHEQKGGKQKKSVTETDTCAHVFTLLNRDIPAMDNALQAGYSAYCSKCFELK